MKTIAAVLTLTWSVVGLADECGDPEAKHWSTVVNLTVAPVTLQWSGAYEAPPGVCRITYKNHAGQHQALEVWGHPDPNAKRSLIALVSCGDDGCSNELVVADIERGKVLKAELPLTDPQFYLTTKWHESGLLRVEAESWLHGQQPNTKRYYFMCSVGKTIDCKQSGI